MKLGEVFRPTLHVLGSDSRATRGVLIVCAISIQALIHLLRLPALLPFSGMDVAYFLIAQTLPFSASVFVG